MSHGHRHVARAVALLLTAFALTANGAEASGPTRATSVPVAVGDLDANGRRDCAIVVEHAVTGGLPAVFIVVFAESDGRWRPFASVELDRGAVVERVRIVTGRLTAAYRRHYPADPPGRPTNATVRSWAFVDGALFGGEPKLPPQVSADGLAARLPH